MMALIHRYRFGLIDPTTNRTQVGDDCDTAFSDARKWLEHTQNHTFTNMHLIQFNGLTARKLIQRDIFLQMRNVINIKKQETDEKFMPMFDHKTCQPAEFAANPKLWTETKHAASKSMAGDAKAGALRVCARAAVKWLRGELIKLGISSHAISASCQYHEETLVETCDSPDADQLEPNIWKYVKRELQIDYNRYKVMFMQISEQSAAEATLRLNNNIAWESEWDLRKKLSTILSDPTQAMVVDSSSSNGTATDAVTTHQELIAKLLEAACCQICCEPSSWQTAQVLTGCGHYMCLACCASQRRISSNTLIACPECKKPDNAVVFNFHLVRVLEAIGFKTTVNQGQANKQLKFKQATKETRDTFSVLLKTLATQARAYGKAKGQLPCAKQTAEPFVNEIRNTADFCVGLTIVLDEEHITVSSS